MEGEATETIVVRGLSVGVAMRRMAGRELFAGVAIGGLLAFVAGPPVCAGARPTSRWSWPSPSSRRAAPRPWWRWGCRGCSIGIDPAFASVPLATVIQNLLSFLIYFGVATATLR